MNAQLVNSLADIIQSLTLEERELLAEKIEPVLRSSFPETLTAQEKAKRFRVWAGGHRRDTPILSDDAISRESIYKNLNY